MEFFPLILFSCTLNAKNCIVFMQQFCALVLLHFSGSRRLHIKSLPLHKKKDQSQEGEQKSQVLEQALMDVKSHREADQEVKSRPQSFLEVYEMYLLAWVSQRLQCWFFSLPLQYTSQKQSFIAFHAKQIISQPHHYMHEEAINFIFQNLLIFRRLQKMLPCDNSLSLILMVNFVSELCFLPEQV